MTPEKQRIAIAETCGWRRWDLSPQQDHPWMAPQGVTANERDMPDYLHDLNAMHETEAQIRYPEELQEQYQEALLKVILKQFGYSGANQLIHATAAQRAEAFLRAIGRWVE